MNEKTYKMMEAAFIIGVISLGVWAYFRPEEPQKTRPYQQIRDSVQERLAGRRMVAIIPEQELLTDEKPGDFINYWGWVISSDSSGMVSTQWFRIDAWEEKGDLYRIDRAKLFLGPPTNVIQIIPMPKAR